MPIHVIITQRALDDMEESATWWRENRSWGEAQRWCNGLERKLRELDDSPRRFPLAVEDAFVPHELPFVPYGLGRRPTHRALFTVDDESSVVRVILVQHVARGGIDPADLEVQ